MSDTLPAVLALLVRARRVLVIDARDLRAAELAASDSTRVVVLARSSARDRTVADLPAPDGVEVVVGEPLASLAHLRTDDDTTFEVIVADITAASAADAVQYVEWALVLGRPGTALLIIAGVDAGSAARDAVWDMVSGHPRLEASALDGEVLVVAAVTDQR